MILYSVQVRQASWDTTLHYIDVWYMGIMIAWVDEEGGIHMMTDRVPVYLVEYLLVQPRLEDILWN